jgi:hypothetical protein
VTVTQEDAELVQKFLSVTKKLGNEERARLVGVGSRTVARWKANEIAPLSDRVRESLEGYLLGGNEDERTAALEVIREVRVKLDQLEARLLGDVARVPKEGFRP